ncbi:MAG TPA: hypothetical protein VGS41_02390, partial [Chthonomonadales bacterium]|nr:hypothetical protein [Chthonomonadales bacterium]
AGALLKYLDAVSAGGGGSLSQALRRFAYGAKAKGIAVVLSDFMDSEWRQGLNALLARGFQVTAIQVLCPEEVEPRLRGDLRVIDSETGASKEMSVNPQLLARYRAALAEFCAELESYSLKRGIDYIRVATSQSWEEVVLTSLLKRGLLR